MKGEKYVIVSSAVRERINRTSDKDHKPIAKVEALDYRKGDLGLFHPAIIDFYSDYDNNMKRVQDEEGLSRMFSEGSRTIPSASNIDHHFYEHDKKGIPILLYNGNLTEGRQTDFKGEEKGYFIILLRDGEFNHLERSSLTFARKSIKKFFKENDLKFRKEQTDPILGGKVDTLDSVIEHHWNYLKAFDITHRKRVQDIPVEPAYIKISKEIQKYEQERWEETCKPICGGHHHLPDHIKDGA